MVVVVKTAKVKKMAATDAKSHENKDIQGHSKSENFKKKIILTEDDVPGASFKNKDPQIFHNEQLKRWLKCRGASVGGSRRELLTRFVVLSLFKELKRFSKGPAVSLTLIE